MLFEAERYKGMAARHQTRAIMGLLWTIVLAIVFTVALVWMTQRRLIYFPNPTRIAPALLDLTGVEERILKRPGGIQVIAWYGKAAPGQPTLLYFHGNAGNLAVRSERIAAYLKRGRGIYMMSYRGYSGSSGNPTEKNNVADAVAAYDDLRSLGVPADDIILYGESLGSGVAVQVAVQRKVGGIVLDAPFTSLVDAGRHHYPYLPVRVGLMDRYDSLARIEKVEAPLLVVHGGRDGVVPIEMGRRLYEAARGPKKFAAFPDAGHSDHHLFGSFQAIQNWIDTIRVPVRVR